jgi:hypothetical protein
MKIFVAVVATLLTILGLLCAWGGIAGEDKTLRRWNGALAVVTLVMAAACFLSLFEV